ncbi:hypothetical protein IAT38_007815 [Cryptococcus sp. DSM 104549]
MPGTAQASAPPTATPASPPPINITSLARFSKEIRSRIFHFLCKTASRPLLSALMRTSKTNYVRVCSRLYGLPVTLDKRSAAKFFYPLRSDGRPLPASHKFPPQLRDHLMNPAYDGYFHNGKRRLPLGLRGGWMRKILLIGGVSAIRIADEEGLKALLNAVNAFSQMVAKEGDDKEKLGTWGIDNVDYEEEGPWDRARRAERMKTLRFPAVLFWDVTRIVFDESFFVELAANPTGIKPLLWGLRTRQDHFVKSFWQTDFCVHLPDAKLSVDAANVMCRVLSGMRGMVCWHNVDPNEFAAVEEEACLEGKHLELYLKPEASGLDKIQSGMKAVNKALHHLAYNSYTSTTNIPKAIILVGCAIATSGFHHHKKRRVVKTFPAAMQFGETFLALGPIESLDGEVQNNGEKEEVMRARALEEAKASKEKLEKTASSHYMSVTRYRRRREAIEMTLSDSDSPYSDFYSSDSVRDGSDSEEEDYDLEGIDDDDYSWDDDDYY